MSVTWKSPSAGILCVRLQPVSLVNNRVGSRLVREQPPNLDPRECGHTGIFSGRRVNSVLGYFIRAEASRPPCPRRELRINISERIRFGHSSLFSRKPCSFPNTLQRSKQCSVLILSLFKFRRPSKMRRLDFQWSIDRRSYFVLVIVNDSMTLIIDNRFVSEKSIMYEVFVSSTLNRRLTPLVSRLSSLSFKNQEQDQFSN